MATNELTRYHPTIVDIEAPPAPGVSWLHNTEPDARLPFGGLYAISYGEHHRADWQGLWDEAIERWLHSGRRRSENTRRTYRRAVLEFRSYLREQHAIYHLWQINDYVAQEWITHMKVVQNYEKTTIGARLAALSSLFNYCANTKTILNGREISLFVDAHGSTRGNPFLGSAVERPRVEQFNEVIAVPNEAYTWIIFDLRQRKASPGNLRNLALLLAFGLNGWRNEEVLSMTWGKIAPNNQRKHEYTYRWTGKARDGVEEKRALPVAIYDAIVAYLDADGRWNPGGPGHIQDEDYIWRPVRVHGCANFERAADSDLTGNRHITQSTCNGVLNTCLRRWYKLAGRNAGLDAAGAAAYAEVQAARFSIHSLRHMFAWNLYVASGSDIHFVSKKLGHKSLATTQIYLEHLKEPVDDHSDLVARQLGLQL